MYIFAWLTAISRRRRFLSLNKKHSICGIEWTVPLPFVSGEASINPIIQKVLYILVNFHHFLILQSLHRRGNDI